MPASDKIVGFEILAGCVERLRLPVESSDARAVLVVRQTPIHAVVGDRYSKARKGLEQGVRTRSRVRVGALVHADGTRRAYWLDCDDHPLILPPAAHRHVARGWLRVFLALGASMACIGLTAYSGSAMLQSWPWAVVFGVGLLTSMAAVCGVYVTSRTLFDFYRWHRVYVWARRARHSPALASNQDGTSWPVPSPTDTPPPDATDSNHPLIHRVSGVLDNLRMEREHFGPALGSKGGRDFNVYRFELNGQTHVFYSCQEWLGNHPFLAEGDRVTLAVQRFEDDASRREALVYAVNNREDRKAYVGHIIFRQGFRQFKGYAMTGMSPRALSAIRWIMLLGVPAFFGLMRLSDFFQSEPIIGSDMVPLLISTLVLWCVAIELPVRLWWLRWKLGYPTRRERLTDRVYQLLALGSPLKRRADIERV